MQLQETYSSQVSDSHDTWGSIHSLTMFGGLVIAGGKAGRTHPRSVVKDHFCLPCRQKISVVIQENVNLLPYNTFKINAQCNLFVAIRSVSDFQSLRAMPGFTNNRKLILGGGSNILFTKDF